MSNNQVAVNGAGDLGESGSGLEGSRRLRDGGQRILPGEAPAGTKGRSIARLPENALVPWDVWAGTSGGRTLYSNHRSQAVLPPGSQLSQRADLPSVLWSHLCPSLPFQPSSALRADTPPLPTLGQLPLHSAGSAVS